MADVVNLYNANAQTIDAGAWGELDLDTQRYADSDWTVDLVNHDVTQDVDGTVILIATATASGGIWTSWKARLEVDTGSGFDAISGASEAQARLNTLAGGATISLIGAAAGSAGDAYRVGVREDVSGSYTTPAGEGGNLVALLAPGDVCWAGGGSDLTATTSYQDVPVTELLAEGDFSVATNEVTLPSDGDYLVLYSMYVQPTSTGRGHSWMRIVSDTGGGYAEISGSEVAQDTEETSSQGCSTVGHMIYAGSSGETLKLQFKGSHANMAARGAATGIVVLKLPSTWQGISAYTASDSTSYTATPTLVPMDAERRKVGVTHSGGEVTLPAEGTTCLVLGTFQARDDGSGSTNGRIRSTLYEDTGGGAAAIAATRSTTNCYAHNGSGQGGYMSAFTPIAKSFSASDTVGLYGDIVDDLANLQGSQLTVLRLDGLTGVVDLPLVGNIDVTFSAAGTLSTELVETAVLRVEDALELSVRLREALARARALLVSGDYSRRDLRQLLSDLSGGADDIDAFRAILDGWDAAEALPYQDGARIIRLWQAERSLRRRLVSLRGELVELQRVAMELAAGQAERIVVTRSGDTWQAIAQRELGDWREWSLLVELNNGDPAVLEAGTRLTIPRR